MKRFSDNYQVSETKYTVSSLHILETKQAIWSNNLSLYLLYQILSICRQFISNIFEHVLFQSPLLREKLIHDMESTYSRLCTTCVK